MSEYRRQIDKAIANVEALARRLACEVDADDLPTARALSVAEGAHSDDAWDCIADLLEWLVGEELEERRAEMTCPECGAWTEPTCERTRDPADERRECREHGVVL